MRCTSPRTVGYQTDGKTLSWSPKNRSKEFADFQLPCGKCLHCRLEYARSWAIRCMHEASIHENNIFLTLTYNDDHLGDGRLDYRDFQLFMKKLRKLQNEPIGFNVVGEYGERTKRKHWHAIIFNFRPSDSTHLYKSDSGHDVSHSSTIERLWGRGRIEFGSVTLDSANYVSRYSAKKLVHGNDDQHQFHPISRKSNKHAIGKRWLERHWPDLFNYGQLLIDGKPAGAIPRYYEKWLQQHQPEAWIHYVTQTKERKTSEAAIRAQNEARAFNLANESRRARSAARGTFPENPLTRNQVRKEIKAQTIQKRLMSFLKL